MSDPLVRGISLERVAEDRRVPELYGADTVPIGAKAGDITLVVVLDHEVSRLWHYEDQDRTGR